MSGISNVQNGSSSRAAQHLTVVGGVGASLGAAGAARASGVSFGSRVETSHRFESGVRAVARACSSIEEAVLPMVLASGVSGDAAVKVADAIMGNPALKAQAERAFQRARMSAV